MTSIITGAPNTIGANMQATLEPSGALALVSNTQGYVPTYSAGTSAFAAVATPTTFGILIGSATKVIKVTKVWLCGFATASTSSLFQLEKWTTAGTLGSAVLTALTATKHDTNSAAATATANTVGTANYTTQGTKAVTRTWRQILSAATSSPLAAPPTVFRFGDASTQPIILRGVAEAVGFQFAGAAIPSGGVFDFGWEWQEYDLND